MLQTRGLVMVPVLVEGKYLNKTTPNLFWGVAMNE